MSWGEGDGDLQIFSLGHAELPLGGGEEVLHRGDNRAPGRTACWPGEAQLRLMRLTSRRSPPDLELLAKDFQQTLQQS